MSNGHIEKAIDDLAYIRGTLETFHWRKLTRNQIKGSIAIHCFLTAIVLFFIGIELVTDNQISIYLDVIRYDHRLKIFTVGYISVLMVLILGISCLSLARVAQKNMQSVQDFLRKNFSYLYHMNLVSDLLVKMVFLSVLIFLDKMSWMTPILLLFVGDFLIQGKIFYFSIKSGIILCLGCFTLAIASIEFNVHSILLPFCVFTLFSILSAWNLYGILGNDE